ncbi:DUF3800 domain-containing protein [Leptospira kanakyensis]|uniref:DUF3800 domain-containing protein n=1 Tax=Leptospira kanakyensis TaxID=2484968 RepID=UPI00223D8755|nr:DUF3800 domain-containing protein [Leptospira kanakyensis]MCW7468192.1 DUF3800 domain-containing protein [Leptospira kanakyensis]
MYFMYIDESGDPGKEIAEVGEARKGSSHYIVSGIIIPITEWRTYLNTFVNLRRAIKQQYEIPVRLEVKGSEFINPRDNIFLKKLNRSKRIQIYQSILTDITSQMNQAKILNVAYRKENRSFSVDEDIQEDCWKFLITRFNTFLEKKGNEYGILFSDETNEPKLRGLVRKMRIYNPVPSLYSSKPRMANINQILEDPVIRKSEHSYFVQIADLIAHALYRNLYPKGSYKKYNVDRLFDILDPILLKEASKKDARGIVYV